ncbi:septal ring lytic transglycosylase RlpA family protein [uncultured Cohaesibacter sp.]|uniref:septal ring lytic transglycosylase RlpA family protein n=1 Tax=uncultured Cohaesibacter sp. TaxID=1002546 RepID=UPI00292E10E5|nr:septal ring lytic transglycosylase RlpA family protein [uncultured Cohaesibacter sp.]
MDVGHTAEPASCGMASWYQHTSRTASGEMADPDSLAAAHRKFEFGTKVRVQNMRNGKTVIVRINDRGPFTKGRILDVTRAAARKLGFIKAGTAKICLETIP